MITQFKEGEEAFTALVENKNPKFIPGVVSRDKGGILFKTGIAPVIKDIDNLPMPEKKFWNIPENEKKNVDVSYVNTIRAALTNAHIVPHHFIGIEKLRD